MKGKLTRPFFQQIFLNFLYAIKLDNIIYYNENRNLWNDKSRNLIVLILQPNALKKENYEILRMLKKLLLLSYYWKLLQWIPS